MTKRISALLSALVLFLAVQAAAPRYVFYFIGDGMGMGHVMTAEAYNRDVLKNPNRLLMMTFPVGSVATTYSANSPITDSAAAGTALSTGHKTNNSMLGLDKDTVRITSIAAELKQKGYGVAVATSVCPDDATPAAFYAHVPTRGMFYEIGKDMAASDYDMFAGAMMRGLKGKDGKDNDLMPSLLNAGYKVCYNQEGYEANKDEKKLLLLSDKWPYSHFAYSIDKKPGLNLPFITKACLEHELKVSPKQFFIMIEGGDIDWAAHGNDGPSAVNQILEFNEAIKVAYDFYLQHPKETLILVSADHDTGGMTFGALGAHKNLQGIKNVHMSKEALSSMCDSLVKTGKPVDWNWMKQRLASGYGLYGTINVSEREDAKLQDAFKRVFKTHDGEDTKTLYATYNEFVTAVYKCLDHYIGFGWTTTSHTHGFVPVYAIGPGCEIFNGVQDNTELPNKLRKLLGLKK